MGFKKGLFFKVNPKFLEGFSKLATNLRLIFINRVNEKSF